MGVTEFVDLIPDGLWVVVVHRHDDVEFARGGVIEVEIGAGAGDGDDGC